MTTGEQPQPPDETARGRAHRRARLEEVFGEVLPETTADERDDDVRRTPDDQDAWIRAQVPPHHG